MDCTVWNEHLRTRLARHRPGPRTHRDIERGKVPSAARVVYLSLLEGLQFTPPSSARTKGDDARYYVHTYLVRTPTFSFSFSVS